MLDGLDKVHWDELSHAYGKATDVPDLLRALASEQKKIWSNALYSLYGNIWHQGTVYSATAYAVPFLLELLRAPAVACKAEILALLQALASGSSYLDAHQSLDWYRNTRETETFQTELRRERDWVRAAAVAVVEGTPVYLELTSHPDKSVRAMAPFVLSTCAKRAEEITPVLLQRASIESDPVVKGSLLLAIARLRQRELRRAEPQPTATAEQQRYLSDLFSRPTEPPVVRLVAALSAVQLVGEPAVEGALPVFRENLESARADFEGLPFIQGSTPLSAVSDALSHYPAARMQLLIETLFHRTSELRKDSIWELGEICRQSRSAPPVVVPYLAKLVADPDPEVRQEAARALPELGRARHLATETLQTLLEHADPKVRAIAAQTLQKIREPRDKYSLTHWLRMPEGEKDIAALIATLEGKGSSPSQHACSDAARALEVMGAEAQVAVPALRNVLSHEYQWVRVHAARALWRITRDPNEVLPVLLEELRCRPVGLLAADCLGEIGARAQAAVPILRRIIDSEVRLVESGCHDDWVDADEGFCEAAKQALARIEGESTA